MSEASSVTTWITRLKSGDIAALANIHRRYWSQMLTVASRKLRGVAIRHADEEDAAQEALLGFYRSVRNGGFPQLTNRHDLLAVLTFITARKAAHLAEYAARKKRGGGRIRGESAFGPPGSQSAAPGIDQIAGAEVSPSERACLQELYEHYISVLPENLRRVAELYLAGHTYREIADRIGCVSRTVERKVPLILGRWRDLAMKMLDESQNS